MKLQLRYDLRNDEEEHDIDSQEFAKIDLGGIQEQAVANEHHCTYSEPAHLLRSNRLMETRLEAGISLHFKVCSQSERGDNSDG